MNLECLWVALCDLVQCQFVPLSSMQLELSSKPCHQLPMRITRPGKSMRTVLFVRLLITGLRPHIAIKVAVLDARGAEQFTD